MFTRTKHGADRVVRELSRAGIQARAIHGDKSQNARQEALSSFKTGKIRVLIATDIAARGIDIAGLSHVFNYDLPNEPESYVHRIGRTGRAGREGIAISFCCIDEMKCLKDIEKLTGKQIPRKESQWPMENFTETVKQPRPSRKEAQAARLSEKAKKEPAAQQPKEKKKPEIKNTLAAVAPVKKQEKKPKDRPEEKGQKRSVRTEKPEKPNKIAPQDASPRENRKVKKARREEERAAQKPEMRATPLSRRTPIAQARETLLPFFEDEPKPRRHSEPDEPTMSYEEFMKKQTRQRQKLFTGSDRR